MKSKNEKNENETVEWLISELMLAEANQDSETMEVLCNNLYDYALGGNLNATKFIFDQTMTIEEQRALIEEVAGPERMKHIRLMSKVMQNN